jgi:hypothetical protein
MAEIILVSWRDIPAQVIARAGRSTAKRVLAGRFQEAIDRAAMRAGLRDSDAYLAEWRRSALCPCGDDLDAEATSAAGTIEADYTDERLRALVANGGSEPQP